MSLIYFPDLFAIEPEDPIQLFGSIPAASSGFPAIHWTGARCFFQVVTRATTNFLTQTLRKIAADRNLSYRSQ
jgi:hypothetical protein